MKYKLYPTKKLYLGDLLMGFLFGTIGVLIATLLFLNYGLPKMVEIL